MDGLGGQAKLLFLPNYSDGFSPTGNESQDFPERRAFHARRVASVRSNDVRRTHRIRRRATRYSDRLAELRSTENILDKRLERRLLGRLRGHCGL